MDALDGVAVVGIVALLMFTIFAIVGVANGKGAKAECRVRCEQIEMGGYKVVDQSFLASEFNCKCRKTEKIVVDN